MHVVKSVGVMSFAKILGILYFCIGLVVAPFIFFAGVLGALAGHGQTPFAGIGMGLAIVLPFFYGLLGFVLGALVGWLYNLLAAWIGGIELELSAP